MERKIMTQSQFVSHLRNGGTIQLEAEHGFVTVTHSNQPGYYRVDDRDGYTLNFLVGWLGFYHFEYGDSVFNAKIL